MPEPQWLADGSAYFDLRPAADGGSEIVRVSAATGATTSSRRRRRSRRTARRSRWRASSISRDGSKILLFHNSVRVWRQNTRGVYDVLDVASGRVDAALDRARAADVREVFPGRPPRGLRAREQSLRHRPRHARGARAHERWQRRDHQRHERLGLRGGARRSATHFAGAPIRSESRSGASISRRFRSSR